MSADSTPQHQQTSRGSISLLVVAITLFWTAQYVPVFSVYAENMGAPLSLVGLAVGFYGFTQMLTRIPLGMWSDGVGKRRIFIMAGSGCTIIGGIGLALSPSPAWLVVFRGVMGLGAATWVCATVLFTSYFPKSHPSLPLGIMTASGAAGQLIGTSLGGELAQRLGWTAPLWATAAAGVIALLALSRAKEDSSLKGRATTWDSFARTARAPLLPLTCVIGTAIFFITYSTMFGFTPVLAAQRFAASRAELGYLTTGALLTYGIISMLASRFISRIGERGSMMLGLILVIAGILPTPWMTTLVALSGLQVLFFAGRGIVYPLLMSMAIKGAAPQDRASAMGIFQAVYGLGMFLGPWISGYVAEGAGLDTVFVLCGCLAAAMLVLAAVFLPRMDKQAALPQSS